MFELAQNWRHQFVTARHWGTVRAAEIQEAREALSRMCEEVNVHQVLVDLREAALDLSLRDALVLADSAAPVLRRHVKTALLRNDKQSRPDDPLTFYESAARNRAQDVRVFGDAAAAEQWLLE